MGGEGATHTPRLAKHRPFSTQPFHTQADPATVADALLADDFVHIDEVWGGAEVVAGRGGFVKFVANVRAAYPDFAVALADWGPAGPHRLFARWTGTATNLGPRHGHKASRHSSALSGIDLITFTPDRSAITEVLVYRTPLAEDWEEHEEGGPTRMHTMRLARLFGKK